MTSGLEDYVCFTESTHPFLESRMEKKDNVPLINGFPLKNLH